MPKKYFIIGSPVAHSLSPQIYMALFRQYGFTGYVYHACEVTKNTLPGFVAEAKKSGIAGFNVTMPLKQEVLPYMDYIDQSAQKGVNTVVQSNGQLTGYSTDAQGFFRALDIPEEALQNKTILFIGAGAVAETLADYAYDSLGIKNILVANRTKEKAERLAGRASIRGGSFDMLQIWASECDILVNTTPLGMEGVSEGFKDLSFLHALKKDALVCDLIYHPAKTVFLQEAEQLGHRVQNGLSMLIWQAFYAFEKYTGILPDGEMFTKILSLLKQNT
jgi:shikimate dehydrogenase